MKKVILAKPRGFCAGVDRAIETVERALEVFGAPIYVRHEVVHNRFVVQGLREKGVEFVEGLDEVPDGAIVIFSAHGVPRSVRASAEARGLRVFDATCPLVTKVHLEVERHLRSGRECVLIGHAGHPEVEGTMGQASDSARSRMHLVERPEDVARLTVANPQALAFVTQTTLSMDDTALVIAALRQRFPPIIGPRKDDICYATQNRQEAVKALALQCDVVFVVGSPNSSNSNRLREIAQNSGAPAYLIDSTEEMDAAWLAGKHIVGVTAGASAPEVLVQSVIDELRAWGAEQVEELEGRSEDVVFQLPKALKGGGRAEDRFTSTL